MNSINNIVHHIIGIITAFMFKQVRSYNNIYTLKDDST